MKTTNTINLTLNKKNVKNLSMDDKIIPMDMTNQIGGGFPRNNGRAPTSQSHTSTITNAVFIP